MVAITITRYLYGTVWVGLIYFGLALFSMEDFRCAEGIPGILLLIFLIEFVFFGLALFFIEDVRCEGIPGNIL